MVVRIEGRRGRRREGRVIRVLERRRQEVLGLLCLADQVYYVEPEDEHLIFNLVIPPEQLARAQPGQMVRAAVTHYPTAHLNPQGAVTEVLGAVEDAEVQTRLVLLKYGLPDEFPPEALAEAEGIPAGLSPRVLKDRLDLRRLPLVTIDGENARDFDDGICVEKKPGGLSPCTWPSPTSATTWPRARPWTGRPGAGQQRLFPPTGRTHAAGAAGHRPLQP